MLRCDLLLVSESRPGEHRGQDTSKNNTCDRTAQIQDCVNVSGITKSRGKILLVDMLPCLMWIWVLVRRLNLVFLETVYWTISVCFPLCVSCQVAGLISSIIVFIAILKVGSLFEDLPKVTLYLLYHFVPFLTKIGVSPSRQFNNHM